MSLPDGLDPAFELVRGGDKIVVVGSDRGAKILWEGMPPAEYPSLRDAITQEGLAALQPGDQLRVSDEDLLDELISVDLDNPDFPGTQFEVAVNGESVEIALDDFGIRGELIAGIDSTGPGDIGQWLYRYGPWLHHWYSGDPDQSYGWRPEGPPDPHAEALEFVCDASTEFGPWDNLTVTSDYLSTEDEQEVIENLRPSIAPHGTLTINGRVIGL